MRISVAAIFAHQHRLLYVLLLALSLIRSGDVFAADLSSRPLVVVSVAPQAYFVRQLVGESVAVEVLLPPGTNHETYEPTIRQARSLAQAALVMTIGHPHFTVERMLLKQIKSGGSRTKVVRTSEGYPLQDDDIHLWTAPSAAKVMAKRTAAALVELNAAW